MISQKEKDYLRELAKQYEEACNTPENDAKRRHWYDINGLKPGTKPVFTNHYWPLAMSEIFPDNTYTCTDEVAREFETYFKSKLFYTQTLGDDNVLEPVVYSRVVESMKKYNDIDSVIGHAGDMGQEDFILSTGKEMGAHDGDAYEIVCVIHSEEDIEKITHPVLKYNKEESRKYYDEACEIFQPTLKVIRQPISFAARVADEYSWFRGLENTYMDIYDDPDMLHRALKKVQTNLIQRYQAYVDAGIYGTLDLSYSVGSAGLRYVEGMPDFRSVDNPFDYSIPLKDCWGNTASELFTCVSKEMHNEFDTEYTKDILSNFAHSNMGCCEVLDKKVDLAANLPNVRKISVSEWCDHEVSAQAIKQKYVYSYRAAGIHFMYDNWDKDAAEKEIRSVLESVKRNGCNTEIVLNIGGTLKANPRQKVMEWSKMTRELINEYYG